MGVRHPLIGIGKKTGWPIAINAGKYISHCLHTIAAEVFHKRGKLTVTATFDDDGNIALIAKSIHMPFAPDSTAHECECRIFCIAAVIYPVP